MKYQILFSWKNWKNITNFLFDKFARRVVKISTFEILPVARDIFCQICLGPYDGPLSGKNTRQNNETRTRRASISNGHG